MNILIMDDMDIRHDLAEKILSKDHLLLHAYTAHEALDTIFSFPKKIDVALLDHDLSDWRTEDGTKVACDEATGIFLVRPVGYDGRIIEHHGMYFIDLMFATLPEEKWPDRCVVHSHNPVAAASMVKLLSHAVAARSDPFSTDMLGRIA